MQFYYLARCGETLIPLGCNILFFPAIRMLITPFYCFEGESSDKLNLEYECDIPCWWEEHTIYFLLAIVTYLAYIIVAYNAIFSHNNF
mmetsp:Transcript_8976/g.1301  ORF Transcript_8976/g.1301 Transcript_8976/m.1301 type:complete len:88 (-) Transcript_8976:16-279(-)